MTYIRLLSLLVVLFLTLAVMSACGGGDPEDIEPEQGRAHVGDPDCVANPEQCR